jgi:hypothetical protein
MAKRRHPRDIGLVGTGAGKGDKERSTDWRKNYDDIDWPTGGRGEKKFHKVYGPTPQVTKHDEAPKAIVH